MNYFYLLPDEIINLIFQKCCHFCNHYNTYVKFKYIIYYKHHHFDHIIRQYMEYTGKMINHNPLSYNKIIQGSAYLNHIPNSVNSIILIQNNQNLTLETPWLYLPFLYFLKNYKLTFISV